MDRGKIALLDLAQPPRQFGKLFLNLLSLSKGPMLGLVFLLDFLKKILALTCELSVVPGSFFLKPGDDLCFVRGWH